MVVDMISRDEANDRGLGGPRGCFVALLAMVVIIAAVALVLLIRA